MRRLAARLTTTFAVALFGAAASAQEAEPRRAYVGEARCPVDLPDDFPRAFTETEERVWQGVCSGDWVGLDRQDARDLPCNPADIDGTVPEHRVIGADFLALILTDKRMAETLAKPQIAVSCAEVRGRLDFENATVAPEFGLYRSHLPQGVQLLRSSFERSLIFYGSTVDVLFGAGGVRIGGTLFLNGAGRFPAVRLVSADIEGGVTASGSVFQGSFNANQISVGGSLFLRGGATFDAVDLLGAEIGGNVHAEGSIFNGLFRADGMRVGGGLFLRNGATLDAVNLTTAEIAQSVQFGASTFNGPVNMTGTRVGGEILLSSPNHGSPDWGEDARLILRNVTADALQAEEAAWTHSNSRLLSTDLTGFAYGRFGGLFAGEAANMADSTADWLIRWIEDTQPDHDARYDPQPYEQLAAALDAAGENAKARAIRVAKFDHRARTPGLSRWERLRLWFSRWLIGHGEYPFNTLGWFAGLVGLGFVVVSFSGAETLRYRKTPHPGSIMAGWFWYSLENALPLVHLKPAHAEAEHGSAWIEGFFHLQKILGFVLATILVGALTVLGG